MAHDSQDKPTRSEPCYCIWVLVLTEKTLGFSQCLRLWAELVPRFHDRVRSHSRRSVARCPLQLLPPVHPHRCPCQWQEGHLHKKNKQKIITWGSNEAAAIRISLGSFAFVSPFACFIGATVMRLAGLNRRHKCPGSPNMSLVLIFWLLTVTRAPRNILVTLRGTSSRHWTETRTRSTKQEVMEY